MIQFYFSRDFSTFFILYYIIYQIKLNYYSLLTQISAKEAIYSNFFIAFYKTPIIKLLQKNNKIFIIL